MGSEEIVADMQISSKAIDLIVVIALALLTLLPSAIFILPSLALIIAWFLAPAGFLILRRKKNLTKITLASLVIGLLAFGLDIAVLHNHGWTPYRSDFSFRIFGAPPEEALWFFFHIFYILVWYEHFLDDERDGGISPRFPSLIAFSIVTFVLVVIAVSFFPDASRIRYAYLTLGVLSMTPIISWSIATRRALLKKFLPLAVFFFLLASSMEIRAVQYGLWSFPDINNYLGVITLSGAAFPIEEIIFWMMLAPSVALAYYELFADDGG